MWVYLCHRVSVRVRGQPQVPSPSTFFWDRVSWLFSSCKYQTRWPSSFQEFATCPYPPSHHAEIITDTWALYEFWGFELRSSCLRGNYCYPLNHFPRPIIAFKKKWNAVIKNRFDFTVCLRTGSVCLSVYVSWLALWKRRPNKALIKWVGGG